MSEQIDEQELKRFQQFIPGAVPETLRDFKSCVKSSDRFMSSIPLGIAGGLIAQFTLPNKLGKMKPFLVYGAGFTMYFVGKMRHIRGCYDKAVSSVALPEGQDRMQLNTARRPGFRIDQQEPDAYSSEPATNFIQESPMWRNQDDSQFESTSNEFSDSPDYFKEEEPSKKQNVEDKRVTYDDLWMQHRKQQMENQYSDLMGYNANKSKQARAAQEKPMEEPTITSSEYDNRNIWN